MTTPITFIRLVKDHDRIEIPIIQRDYAQGRRDQEIVRQEFLAALREALSRSSDDPALPLNLDFIYGSVIGGAFQPLDGQQRLTTLFLLHWYLAVLDNCGPAFRDDFVRGSKSSFGYLVRPASREFIDALAVFEPESPFQDLTTISTLIQDQAWYVRTWKFDPTVQACLGMLDTIHKVFLNSTGFYTRLTDSYVPAITFQLLDLENFDLSDDLYIKMNARGKPLTAFETFKARFERHLAMQYINAPLTVLGKEVEAAELFSHCMDTRWSDFFWPYRDKSSAIFDSAVMNLLRVVAMITRSHGDSAKFNAALSDLRRPEAQDSFTAFHDRGWLDGPLAQTLISLLERWSGRQDGFRRYLPDNTILDEEALFRKIIAQPKGLTFEELVIFAGYAQYLVLGPAEVDAVNFRSWMRVVVNLARNTDYNRIDDMRRSVEGLLRLSTRMTDVLEHLVEPEFELPGFARDQVREERVKAQLLLMGQGWPERIEQAEQSIHFRCQIGFLLRFCGLDLLKPNEAIEKLEGETGHSLHEHFETYLKYAERMFDDLQTLPKTTGRLWERALLTVGDYLLRLEHNNRALPDTIRGEAWSWKRFLREAASSDQGLVLKGLWDRLSSLNGMDEVLGGIIKNEPNVEGWRRAIVDTPDVYDYGVRRMLRFDYTEKRIYVLNKSFMNSTHVELFTYCLWRRLVSTLRNLVLTPDYYPSTSSEDEPGLFLSRQFLGVDINFFVSLQNSFQGDDHWIYLNKPQEPNETLTSALKELGFAPVAGWWGKLIKVGDLEASIIELDRVLERYELDERSVA